MKEIQPFTFWANGKTLIASYLFVICNTDNLKDSAQFYWSFYDKIDGIQGKKISEGNLTMIPPDYDLYETNEFAWNWAANQLGVTIIPSTIGEIPAIKKGKKV
jgi:hypothetical protein